jgi:hypothetical protein
MWARAVESEKQRGLRMFIVKSCRPALACRAFLAASCALLPGPAASVACAAGTILSTGFESPYTPTQLEGQSGWVAVGGVSSTATVQNSIKLSGSQAVRVVKAANSNRRWAVRLDGYPTQSLVAIDWDMLVSRTPNSTSFGPFFGVEAYDDEGQEIGLFGSLGVDATTGDVLYQAQDTGYFTETNSNVVFNRWHHYRLLLDFDEEMYHGYFDGQLIASTGFVDRDLNLDDFTDADISALAAAPGAEAAALSSFAVIDNFLIRDGFGDYDVDGDVDTADYDLWRSTYDQTVSIPGNGADGSGNGVVDAADYVVWRKNQGPSQPGGASSINFPVPEPTSALLALLSLQITALATARRRRGV